jgi:hypothetical protein
MTGSSDQRTSVRGEFQLMARDLGCMSGTLSEIATVWRRARPCRPDLPLGLPLQLEAVTHQLARTVGDLAGAGPGQRPGLALLLREQMSALERDVAAARAMTCGADIAPVGDTGLWERLGAAMQQARARVPDRYFRPSAGACAVGTARAASTVPPVAATMAEAPRSHLFARP